MRETRFPAFSDGLATMRADPDLLNSISGSAGDGQPLNDDQIRITKTRSAHQISPKFSRGLRPRTPGHVEQGARQLPLLERTSLQGLEGSSPPERIMQAR